MDRRLLGGAQPDVVGKVFQRTLFRYSATWCLYDSQIHSQKLAIIRWPALGSASLLRYIAVRVIGVWPTHPTAATMRGAMKLMNLGTGNVESRAVQLGMGSSQGTQPPRIKFPPRTGCSIKPTGSIYGLGGFRRAFGIFPNGRFA